MNKEIITKGEDGVFICPHCNVEQGEHPENMLMDTDNYDEIECDVCYELFSLTKEMCVQYITTAISKK